MCKKIAQRGDFFVFRERAEGAVLEVSKVRTVVLSDAALVKAFYSPARFTPVMMTGARYRTSIQELLHPRKYSHSMQPICKK